MQGDHWFVRAAAARIAGAADATSKALGEGLVRSSGAFTDRFVRRAAEQVDRFESHELRWRAQAWLDREGSAVHVAEILGVLEVALPDYRLRKGFLARTLLLEEGRDPTHEDLEELRKACAVMLAVTPAAYVFVYRVRGVIVVPAGAVVASVARPDRLHRRQIGRFYEEHFSSFIGDARVARARDVPLEELARQHQARCGLALHVEPAAIPRQESLFRR